MMIDHAALALLSMQRHSWEQGVTMQAFYELGAQNVVICLAKEAAYRRLADGRLAVMDDTNAVTDPCSVGEALAFAVQRTQDAEMSEALEALSAWALHDAPRNVDGLVYHVMDAPQIWVDSMYMLPPFLAAIGEHEAALHQMLGYDAILCDPETRLLGHQWDDGAQRFVRSAHWGVGNGWALAGYARLIGMMPEYRTVLVDKAVSLIGALLPYMREDGLFHDVVDDPQSFVETNLSQMLCYTLCRGICEGWLERMQYEPIAHKLHNAALSHVDEYGIVRGVCGAPTFDKPGTAPEGQAFLLMMEHQWKRLTEIKA